MANNPTNFFAAATANRLAAIPAAGALASYGNMTISGQGGAEGYESRTRASQVNGAQNVADSSSAPWNFVDFALGKKSIQKSTASAVLKRGHYSK